MSTCYLHLGMPKTGSSSIQEAFSGYEDADVAYAKMKQKNHQIQIELAFSENPAKLQFFRRREVPRRQVVTKQLAAKLALRVAVSNRKSTIFSGEGMLDQLTPAEIHAMLKYFKSHYDRLVPIIYVRPLASLTSSQFQQRVKTGLATFKLPDPAYRKRFQPVVDDSNVDEITFVRFDRSSLIGGDVVTDFTRRVGASRVPETVSEANESLSAEAVGALFGFNKYTGWHLRPKQRTRMLREMFKSLQGMDGRKFGFSEDILENHLAAHAADIDWIEKIAGFDVTGEIKTVSDPVKSEEHLLAIAAEVSTEQFEKFKVGNK